LIFSVRHGSRPNRSAGPRPEPGRSTSGVNGVHGVEIIYTSPVTPLTDWAITRRISAETGEPFPDEPFPTA